ncbi:flagellar basal body rod protein FlgC [Kistimonas scapharcae]|uniref:Flagellar basal-body rod protein FlgC n=1 Tax=Kistimonas scapharcae TaxID=1036133 RepID=A0ABP8V0N1_9GAMM
MSLSDVFTIAGSAATAQTIRLNTIASNMANVESAGATPEEAYKVRKPVFSQVLVDQGRSMDSPDHQVMMVAVNEILEVEATDEDRRYMPDHPGADAEGYVYFPKVNVIGEMADMMSASRSYQSSIELMATAKKMQQRLLTLGQ